MTFPKSTPGKSSVQTGHVHRPNKMCFDYFVCSGTKSKVMEKSEAATRKVTVYFGTQFTFFYCIRYVVQTSLFLGDYNVMCDECK